MSDDITNRSVDETAMANSIGGILSFLKGAGNTIGQGVTQDSNNVTGVGPIANNDNLSNLSPSLAKPPASATAPGKLPANFDAANFAPQGGGADGNGEANPVPNGPEPISQGYGHNGHPGIDIGVPVGTTLVAAISGKITAAGNTDPHGYGNEVEITGPGGLVVRYGHLSYVGAKIGDTIRAGQPIGKSGGDPSDPNHGNSDGPHLHFEVRINGHTIDPSHFLAIKGNGIVAGKPGDLPPTGDTTTTGPDRTIAPQDATDTAVGRLTGLLSGKGDPGSENQVNQVTTTTPGQPAPPGATNVDTSNLQGMDKYFARVLAGIGAPVTPANLQFMRAWQRAEGGDSTNPFNTTQGAAGATTFNSVGVKRYASQESGIGATTQTLLNGYYSNILAALRAGNDAMAAANALAASPWGTGGLVQQILRG